MKPVLELGEYSRRTLGGVLPSDRDLELAAGLAETHARKLEIRWLAGKRIEVVSTSWVGVVELDCCRIEVRPKFAGESLGVIKMLAYTSGVDALWNLEWIQDFDTGADLVDLLCMLLAKEVSEVVRNGVIRDYIATEDSLTALRGSLRFREQATRRFGQLDVLECRFDEFESDVFDNQLLLAGLESAAKVCSHLPTRRILRRSLHALGEIASSPSDPLELADRRRIYSRRNEHYREAHEISSLVIRNLGLGDLYSSGSTRSFTFLLDMNHLFEAFVTQCLRDAFARETWRVDDQVRVRSVIRERSTGRTYSSIIPDVVMTDGVGAIPFDAKYKLYGGDRKVATGDIFQSFVYAYALGDQSPALAGVIYPASSWRSTPALAIGSVGGADDAHLTGIGVDLLDLVDSLSEPDAFAAALGRLRNQILPILEMEKY